MKKLIVFLLTLALMISLSACRRSKEVPEPEESKPLSGTMEENINKIMEENPVEFMGDVTTIDLKDTTEDGLLALTSYTGLSSGEKLKDGAVYEPMMGSQAFSLVLVRVADAKEAESVAREMKQNINPRKWICVEANQIMAAGYGDVVMFIMLDSQLGKTAQSFVDAFQKVCGGKLDFTI